jgi:DNA-nicking Smr family endonuclease
MRKNIPDKPKIEEDPGVEFESAIFAAELGEAPEIDLHGETVDAALHDLDRFLHQELMGGSEVIRIIHGRGNQILHKAIHVWLEKQKKWIWSPTSVRPKIRANKTPSPTRRCRG